jgi:glyoxylase-like metal-dependent hydrolase (beta-lactamase superfamily II)
LNPDYARRPQAELHPSLQRQVHTITDRFSMANTYVILDEEQLIVVDPGTELNVRQLQYYIPRVLQRSLENIDLIVLTHLHPDHTAGMAALRKISTAPVAAAAIMQQLVQVSPSEYNLTPRLTQLAEYLLPGTLQHYDLFPSFYTQQVKQVDLWLHDAEGLPGHPNWRVIASPGHTPESLCLYNPFSWELLCGDTVITIQGGAPLLRAGTDRKRLEETLHVLRSLHVHYLYPGHGRPILALLPLKNVDIES